MKCKCESEEDMAYVGRFEEDRFATVTTTTIYYCFDCGRLLKQASDMGMPDWWEPKAIEKKRKAEERMAAKKAKERKERKEYERLKKIYG